MFNDESIRNSSPVRRSISQNSESLEDRLQHPQIGLWGRILMWLKRPLVMFRGYQIGALMSKGKSGPHEKNVIARAVDHLSFREASSSRDMKSLLSFIKWRHEQKKNAIMTKEGLQTLLEFVADSHQSQLDHTSLIEEFENRGSFKDPESLKGLASLDSHSQNLLSAMIGQDLESVEDLENLITNKLFQDLDNDAQYQALFAIARNPELLGRLEAFINGESFKGLEENVKYYALIAIATKPEILKGLETFIEGESFKNLNEDSQRHASFAIAIKPGMLGELETFIGSESFKNLHEDAQAQTLGTIEKQPEMLGRLEAFINGESFKGLEENVKYYTLITITTKPEILEKLETFIEGESFKNLNEDAQQHASFAIAIKHGMLGELETFIGSESFKDLNEDAQAQTLGAIEKQPEMLGRLEAFMKGESFKGLKANARAQTLLAIAKKPGILRKLEVFIEGELFEGLNKKAKYQALLAIAKKPGILSELETLIKGELFKGLNKKTKYQALLAIAIQPEILGELEVFIEGKSFKNLGKNAKYNALLAIVRALEELIKNGLVEKMEGFKAGIVDDIVENSEKMETYLSKRNEEKFQKWMRTQTYIQSPEDTFKNMRSLFVADLLFDEAGKLKLKAIDEALVYLKFMGSASKAYDSDFLSLLMQLKTDPVLQRQLEAFGIPTQGSIFEEDVRQALAIPASTELTARDTRMAVLSAMLGDIRQDTGTCFATAIMNDVHRKYPKLFLADISGFYKNGFYERTIDGKTVQFYPPKEIFNENLEKMMPVEDGKIFETPIYKYKAFARALEAAGIPEARQKDLIAQGIKIGDPSKQMNAQEILKRVLMQETGISLENLENRTTLIDLGKTARMHTLEKPSKGKSWDEIDEAINRSIDALNTFREKSGLKNKDEALSRFDRLLKVATNSFTSGRNNKILRSWELSIVPASSNVQNYLISSLMEGLSREIRRIGFDQSKGTLVETEFEKLFYERVGVKYEDGQRIFFDKTGLEDSNEATSLKTPKQLQPTIAGLLLETTLNLKEAGSLTQEDSAKMSDVSDSMQGTGFLQEWNKRFITTAFSTNPGDIKQPIEKKLDINLRKVLSMEGQTNRVYRNYFAIPSTSAIIHYSHSLTNAKDTIIDLIEAHNNGAVFIDFNGQHACILALPQEAMLANSARNWVEKHLDEGFIYADTNWVSNGQHLYLGMKQNSDGNIEIYTCNERGVQSGNVDNLGQLSFDTSWLSGKVILLKDTAKAARKLERSQGL